MAIRKGGVKFCWEYVAAGRLPVNGPTPIPIQTVLHKLSELHTKKVHKSGRGVCIERVQREWEGKSGTVDMIKIH